ncbi:pumilio-family RNA binding repeat protein [Diaporthe helianthi]|uniref:Pumilio-family RNA binding repeat protein n=1 Tax=Diaporthe helianthi TaxID=158607 RepID=A0A2P5I5N2_DIAHE|nr:pumilio-family RNA binding repeat protein [Diaporthe helianthi]
MPQDENARYEDAAAGGQPALRKSATPLTTSKLSNQNSAKPTYDGANPMDKLLAKLCESHEQPSQNDCGEVDNPSSCSSMPITPATDAFGGTAPTTRPASAAPNDNSATEEVLRLKLELAKAQSHITNLNNELAQSRRDQGSGRATPILSSDSDYAGGAPLVEPIGTKPPAYPPMSGLPKTQLPRENAWQGPVSDDCRSEISDAMSATGYNRSRGISSNANKPTYQPSFMPPPLPLQDGPHSAGWSVPRDQGFIDQSVPPYNENSMDGFRGDRFGQQPDLMRSGSGRRGNRYDNRFGNPNSYGSNYGGYGMGAMGPSQYDGPGYPGGPGSMPGNGIGMFSQYGPSPIGTPLSPHATEFTSTTGGSWKTEAIATEGQTYLPTTEPLNYRRLLDRNVNCNWKYIVDKIVCNNDQQASIFLQQKLKVGTPEQKYEIVEAIVAQAYPLMVNRFGNFLVQRCFEHGTPEQVIKIAEAIRGNTLNLSMDPFGCHVVQKAFDSVPEDYKAIMVHELLRRIPETVIHRYACHVWQKLFELRWTESPPQIMKFVNEALRGMWHEVALGETGSLVRPCIEEVLANIDIVAHGQFGNWCIQHICEHGAPADRSRAIDHVIRYAAEYSMDQFASKVVEKCLKIGGPEFLGRYLDRVSEGRLDRPRIPLIDIASDQYGNYLIQYILTHANTQHRDMVAAHIRKHMVSLRGSKFGSRVGMLCTNPAVATRPGPGVGPIVGNRMAPGPRFGGAYR